MRMEQPAMPRPQPLPMPMPMPSTGMGMGMTPQGGMGMSVQFHPSNDPTANELYSKTMPIYNAIVEINPSYKNTVGSCIFEFVTKIVGPSFAPKITGMLIDLPISEIQKYCTNYDLFVQRVSQAQQLLVQQQVVQN
jgi:hypothetical protein